MENLKNSLKTKNKSKIQLKSNYSPRYFIRRIIIPKNSCIYISTTRITWNLYIRSLKTKSENNFEDKIRDNTINRGEKSNNNIISEDLAIKIKLSKGEGTQKERIEMEIYVKKVNEKER